MFEEEEEDDEEDVDFDEEDEGRLLIYLTHRGHVVSVVYFLRVQ